MPLVHFPPQLREFTGGRSQVRVGGKNMRQVVAALEKLFPGIAEHLQDGDRFVSGITASIDGVATNRGMLAEVKPDSEIHFHPPLVGG